MRIRTIKPEFWEDELLASLPPHSRLAFIATWQMADINGVIEWRERLFMSQVFPYEDLDASQVLHRLFDLGFLSLYEVEGKKYAIVNGFRKHQRISGKEVKFGAKHPLPPEGFTAVKLQGSTREATWCPGKEGKGKERKGRFVAPTEDDVKSECENKSYQCNPMDFFDFYACKGWVVGKSPMKDWRRALSRWNRTHISDGKPDYREVRAKRKSVEAAAIKLAQEAEEEAGVGQCTPVQSDCSLAPYPREIRPSRTEVLHAELV